MNYGEGGLSASDVALLTNGRSGNNDGFGDGNGWWIIIFLIFALGGWGRNGFGGGFDGGNGGAGNMYGFGFNPCCTPATQQGLSDAFNFNNLDNYHFNIIKNYITKYYPEFIERFNNLSNATSIGHYAFNTNVNLTTVIVNRDTPATVGMRVFDICNALQSIYVPDAAVSAYQSAWSDYENKIKAISQMP